MNKKLLTAVVVTTLSASPAAVLAAAHTGDKGGSSASIYGKVDIGVQIVDPGTGYNGEKTFVDDRQGSGGSLIGWSISEDLGGGMKGIAKVELGFFTDTGNLDNGDNQAFQRQVWAGLTGGFGTVTAGRQYRELFLVGNSNGAYAYTNAQIGVFFLNTSTGVRQSNYIKYVSPTFGGGLKFALGFDPQGSADATTNPGGGNTGVKADKYTDYSLSWASGPLKAGIAIGTDTQAGVDVDSTVVAGQYTFGPSTVYGLYSKSEVTPGNAERTGTSLGYKHKVGMGDIVFVYGLSEVSPGTNADSTLMALAYYYDLGKNTTVYAAYGTLDNDPGAQLSLPRQSVGTIAAGDDPTAWSFGVTVTF